MMCKPFRVYNFPSGPAKMRVYWWQIDNLLVIYYGQLLNKVRKHRPKYKTTCITIFKMHDFLTIPLEKCTLLSFYFTVFLFFILFYSMVCLAVCLYSKILLYAHIIIKLQCYLLSKFVHNIFSVQNIKHLTSYCNALVRNFRILYARQRESKGVPDTNTKSLRANLTAFLLLISLLV